MWFFFSNLNTIKKLATVNVEIFALYILSRYSRFSNIRENMYNLKITYIIPHRGINIKNAKSTRNCQFS